MSVQVVSSLIIYMLINSFTPGPGNLLALNTMTRMGWNKGKRILVGTCVGYFGVQFICVVIIGLFSLSQSLVNVLLVMKYIGAVYLLWLAFHIMRSRPGFDGNEKMATSCSGLLLQFMNVKIYFYGMTVLSGYITPYYHRFQSLLFAGGIVALVGSFATLAWAFMGVKLQRLYCRYYQKINMIFGAGLIFCAWSLITY